MIEEIESKEGPQLPKLKTINVAEQFMDAHLEEVKELV